MGIRGLTQAQRFWSKVTRGADHECWLWNGCLNKTGYGIFMIGRKVDGQTSAHRMSMELAGKMNVHDKVVVRHGCDNRRCVNPAHLSLGTLADNSRDMVERGRSCRGVKNPIAKLNDDLVRQMRAEYATGQWEQRPLAAKYGVSQRCLLFIIKREHWKHVA